MHEGAGALLAFVTEHGAGKQCRSIVDQVLGRGVAGAGQQLFGVGDGLGATGQDARERALQGRVQAGLVGMHLVHQADGQGFVTTAEQAVTNYMQKTYIGYDPQTGRARAGVLSLCQ